MLGWSCEFRGGSVLGLCGVLIRLGEGEEKRGRERNPMPVCLRSLVADSALPFNYPLLGSDDGCFPPIHHSFTHRMDFIYAHDLNWYLFSISNENCYDSITFENFAFCNCICQMKIAMHLIQICNLYITSACIDTGVYLVYIVRNPITFIGGCL